MGGRSGYSGVSGAGATSAAAVPAPAAVTSAVRPAPAPTPARSRNSSAGITVPAPVTRVSQQNITAAAKAAGLEGMSFRSLTNNDIGRTFVVTEPVVTRPGLFSRTDPESVRFEKMTYAGRSNSAFAHHVFTDSTGRRRIVDDEMYVRLFKKAGT